MAREACVYCMKCGGVVTLADACAYFNHDTDQWDVYCGDCYYEIVTGKPNTYTFKKVIEEFVKKVSSG